MPVRTGAFRYGRIVVEEHWDYDGAYLPALPFILQMGGQITATELEAWLGLQLSLQVTWLFLGWRHYRIYLKL